MDEHVGAVDERARVARRANVAAQLLDRRSSSGVVERREVERPHLVPVGDEPPREVQAEKARAAEIAQRIRRRLAVPRFAR